MLVSIINRIFRTNLMLIDKKYLPFIDKYYMLQVGLENQSQEQSFILKEFFKLVNILIYPQRIQLASNQQFSAAGLSQNTNYDSQSKVRDIILYLKVIKQILNIPENRNSSNNLHNNNKQQQDEDHLFALSDIIDDNKINQHALIRHLMYLWESIIGKKVDKIQNLEFNEILDLQRDLEPEQVKSLQIRIWLNIDFSKYDSKPSLLDNKPKSVQKVIQTEDDQRINDFIQLQEDYKEIKQERDVISSEKMELLREKHTYNEKYSELQNEFEEIQERLDRKTQKCQKYKEKLLRFEEEGVNKQGGVERLQEEINILTKQKLEAEQRTKKFESQFRSGLKEIDQLRDEIEQLQNEKKQIKQQENDLEGGLSEQSSFIIFNQPNTHHDMRVSELEKEKEVLLQKIQMLEKINKELVAYKKALEETIDEIAKEQDNQKRLQMVNFNLIRRKSLLRLEHSQLFSDVKPLHTPDKTERQLATTVINQYMGQKQSMFDQFLPGNKNSKLQAPSSVLDMQSTSQFNTSQNDDLISPNYQTTNGVRNQPDLNEILEQIQRMDSEQNTPAHRTQNNIQMGDSNDHEYGSNQTHSLQMESRRQSVSDNRNNNILSGLIRENSNQKSLPRLENDKSTNSVKNNVFTNDAFTSQNNQQTGNFNKNDYNNNFEDDEEEEKEEEDEPENNNIFNMLLKKQMTQKLQEQNKSQNIINADIKKQVIKEAEDEDEYDEESDSSSDSEEEFD
ncbi:UNKNOWN [Stylonychia lemnae]|uniref:Uncharacterized protein n=1 Tax=Stylonychia lemnae TaxID=5949 RepID=A0A078A2Z0_STYLE|nr:UNKNOWN [Stylonychia lemnae]|eukprot:CDW76648.1 UNKNOWN [Stylonychia lemnae]